MIQPQAWRAVLLLVLAIGVAYGGTRHAHRVERQHRCDLANEWLEAGKIRHAESAFQQLRWDFGEDPQFLTGAEVARSLLEAQALLQSHRFPEALQKLTAAQELGGERGILQLLLSRALRALGRTAEADAELKRAKELAPQSTLIQEAQQ
jgi:hypothetical protein